MPNFRWIKFILPVFSLGIALIILVIPITERNGIQVIILQPLYAILDKSWLLFRSLVFVVVSTIGIVVLRRNAQNIIKNRKIWYFVAMIAIGMIASLIIFYGFSCCDSPVVYFMGFPFSWLRGITPAQHYLPMTEFQYLINNFRQFDWNIDAFSLIASTLFWFNIALLLVMSKQNSWLQLPKRKDQQKLPKTAQPL